MRKLLGIMRQLRAPDGCPWDQKQTHESLRRYLLEEAAEAVDAISSGDPSEMADELGDVLLQVAFHAVIGEEEGTFGYEDIEEAIVSKLVRRHPHVFGDVSVSGADEVLTNWQAIKADEKAGEAAVTPAERVPRALPALARAAAMGKAVGWKAPATLTETLPNVAEGPLDRPLDEAVGRHLLAVAQFARENGVDPELALRAAIDEAATETEEE